jgi:chaperonin GroES
MLKANERYVVIEVEKNPNVTPGGIVLPENAVGGSNKGVVVSDGDAELFEDGEGFVGRTVFFPLYSGNKVQHEGKEYLVLKSEDILAYVSKD